MAELIINRIEEGLFTHTLTVDEETEMVIDSKPALTSFRKQDGSRFFNFKTDNGAPLIFKQRITPPEITITDSFGGTPAQTGFTSEIDVWLALGNLGYFQGFAGGSGGGGVSSFINLTDVNPNLYLGFGGMVYVVNDEETGLIPETFYNYHLLTQNDDVSALPITSNDVGKVLAVQMDGTNPKFMLTDLPQNGVIIPNGFTDLGEQTLVDGEYTATVGYEWNYSNIHYGLIEDYQETIETEEEGIKRRDIIVTLQNEFTHIEGVPTTGTPVEPDTPLGSLKVTDFFIDGNTITEPTQPNTGFVESVTGNSVDNTDPLNPIVKAVPIQGTFPGEPITGDLEVIDGTSIKSISENGGDPITSKVLFSSSVNMVSSLENGESSGIYLGIDNLQLEQITSSGISGTLFITNSGARVESTNPDSKGIISSTFFDKQNDTNAFAQLGDLEEIQPTLDDVLLNGNITNQPIISTLNSGIAFEAKVAIRTQGFSYASTFEGTKFRIGGGTESPSITASGGVFKTNQRIDGLQYFDKQNDPNSFAQLGDVAGVNETTGIFSNIQPLIDSAPKGVTVNLLKGANYDDQDNAVVLKEGSLLNLNGATLKRAAEQIVLTTVSANQASTSITVASVPAGWKVGDYLQLFTDNTFNTASRKYEAIIESIVGNVITFTGALKPAYGTTYTWGIGTKVRKVFSQITAPRSYDLFTQPTKWLVYNGTIDGNKDENSGNLYWGANMGIANNGRAGLLAVDIINQPNEAVMGSGFSINLCNIDSVNGSFIHYTADINVGESILGGEISNNIVSNTNIADSETVTGHSEAVITFSYTSGRSNVNNNRFLGGGGKVLGTVSYASESEDGSLQEFYFNNNYCKGYEGIINNFVYNGSAIRIPDNVIISENIFEDCGVNDWNPYGSNINNYGKFKFDNNVLNGTTTLKGVPNKMLFDRKILQTIEWNNSATPTLFFREFRDIKSLTANADDISKNLIRVSLPLSNGNIFSFKLEIDEYEQDGVPTNKRTLSEISVSGIKFNTASGWNASVLAQNANRFTSVKTGLNTAGDRMVAYIYLNGASSIKDITLSNLKLKNANSDQALLLEDSENYGLTLETSETDFRDSFTVNRADFIGYQPDIVSNTNSSASTLSLTTPARTNYYQHTGTGATWTLPDATINAMNRIVCTHKGTGVLTINSLPNQIWESGVPVSTYVVAIGESVNFYPDGVNWIVL